MRRTAFALLLPLLFIALCCAPVSDTFRLHLQPNLDRNVLIMTGDGSMCAGVILRNGVIATAKHCLAETLTVDGKPAIIAAVSHEFDVAILLAKTKEVEPVEFNDRPQQGEPVYSIVNVAGFKNILSRSYIIGFSKEKILTENIGAPGISGAGYYDERGRLIGIGSQYAFRVVENQFSTGHHSVAVKVEEVENLLPPETEGNRADTGGLL